MFPQFTEACPIEGERPVWINPAQVCSVVAVDRLHHAYTDTVRWNTVVMPSSGVPICLIEDAANVLAALGEK